MSERELAPRGAGRPLVEAALVLAFFYATALIPLGHSAGGGRLAEAGFYLELLGLGCARILAVLLVAARSEGLRAFGLSRLRARDLPKAIGAAAGAAAIAAAAAAAAAASVLGATNPLFSGLPRGNPVALVPLVVVSSMATGYAEELAFRAYLIRRLEGAGLGPAQAAVASSLLFGGAHWGQGAMGAVAATLLGLWFAWRWREGRSIHEVSIGHGLYDSAVLAAALYAA